MAWPSPYNGMPSYTPMPPNCIGFPYHPSGVNVHYPLAPSCGGMYPPRYSLLICEFISISFL